MKMLSLGLLLGVASLCEAAPALPEKPVQWEYAILLCQPSDGVGKDGERNLRLRFTTDKEEISVRTIDEASSKLGIKNLDKEASGTRLRIQILNHFGKQGWEAVESLALSEHAAMSSFNLLLKRRVP